MTESFRGVMVVGLAGAEENGKEDVADAIASSARSLKIPTRIVRMNGRPQGVWAWTVIDEISTLRETIVAIVPDVSTDEEVSQIRKINGAVWIVERPTIGCVKPYSAGMRTSASIALPRILNSGMAAELEERVRANLAVILDPDTCVLSV